MHTKLIKVLCSIKREAITKIKIKKVSGVKAEGKGEREERRIMTTK
jgi:hypothetical protein